MQSVREAQLRRLEEEDYEFKAYQNLNCEKVKAVCEDLKEGKLEATQNLSCAVGEKEEFDNKETCLDTNEDVQIEVMQHNKGVNSAAQTLVCMNLLESLTLSKSTLQRFVRMTWWFG